MSCVHSSAARNEGPRRIGASPPRLREASGRVSTRFESARRLDLSCARARRSQIAAPTFLPSRKFPVGWAIAPYPSGNSPTLRPPGDSRPSSRPSALAFLDRSSPAYESQFAGERAMHRPQQHASPSDATASHRPVSRTSGQTWQPPNHSRAPQDRAPMSRAD